MKSLVLCVLCWLFATSLRANVYDSTGTLILKSTNNKEKSALYEQMAVYWQDKNPDSAIRNFAISLDFAQKVDEPTLEHSLIQYTRFLFSLGRLDVAEQTNLQYLQYFKKQKQNDGIATAYTNLGTIQAFQGNKNEALRFLNQAAKYCSETNKALRVSINIQIGDTYSRQGKYNESLELLQSTLKIADSVKGSNDYYGIVFTIGNIYGIIGDKETALRYFERVANAMRQSGDNIGLANAYSNMAAGLGEMKRFPEAEKYAYTTLELVKNSNPTIVANALIGLTDLLIKQRKFQEAKPFLNQLDTIATVTNDPMARVWTDVSRANILFEEKNYTASLRHLHSALPAVQEGGDLQEMSISYSLLYRNYEQLGDYPNAFKWLAKYNIIKDSVLTESKIKELTLLQSKLENEKRDALIAKEKQRQIIIRNSLIGLTFALLIIALLIFNRQRLKHQNKQQLLLSEKQLAEQELKNATEQLNEIGTRIREKNELIEKASYEIGLAKQEIQSLKERPAADIPITSALVADEHSLLQLQESILLTNEDWDKFSALFGKVHSGFFSRLKLKFPGLSPAETRFMALCKLKYAPKDMAGMLGIGKDAIRQYRSRLKKKLSLGEDVSFEELADQV